MEFWQLYDMPAVETDIGIMPAETVEACSASDARYLESIGGVAVEMNSYNISAWNRAYECAAMMSY